VKTGIAQEVSSVHPVVREGGREGEREGGRGRASFLDRWEVRVDEAFVRAVRETPLELRLLAGKAGGGEGGEEVVLAGMRVPLTGLLQAARRVAGDFAWEGGTEGGEEDGGGARLKVFFDGPGPFLFDVQLGEEEVEGEGKEEGKEEEDGEEGGDGRGGGGEKGEERGEGGHGPSQGGGVGDGEVDGGEEGVDEERRGGGRGGREGAWGAATGAGTKRGEDEEGCSEGGWDVLHTMVSQLTELDRSLLSQAEGEEGAGPGGSVQGRSFLRGSSTSERQERGVQTDDGAAVSEITNGSPSASWTSAASPFPSLPLASSGEAFAEEGLASWGVPASDGEGKVKHEPEYMAETIKGKGLVGRRVAFRENLRQEKKGALMSSSSRAGHCAQDGNGRLGANPKGGRRGLKDDIKDALSGLSVPPGGDAASSGTSPFRRSGREMALMDLSNSSSRRLGRPERTRGCTPRGGHDGRQTRGTVEDVRAHRSQRYSELETNRIARIMMGHSRSSLSSASLSSSAAFPRRRWAKRGGILEGGLDI
jgi:hypothetical protein